MGVPEFLPWRGGEGGESARRGEARQSANFDSGAGVSLLRRMGDAAGSQTFYTFYTSTRLNKRGEVLPCRFLPWRGGEVGESARQGEALQSANGLPSRRTCGNYGIICTAQLSIFGGDDGSDDD